METEHIITIFKSLVKMQKKINALDNILMDTFTEYFGDELQAIQDTILDLCGVPAEETDFDLLGIDTKSYPDNIIEYGFCRDSTDDKIWDLANIDDENELETACEFVLMAIMEEWDSDEQYITKRGE